MNLSIPITARLKLIKNLLSVSLLATVLCTWPLWWPNRYYPVFPESSLFASVNHAVACALPFLLVVALLLAIMLRNARWALLFAAVVCFILLLLDTGRTYYWFYFYIVFLLLFGGYNGRVDHAGHYSAYYNAVKLLLAGLYVIAAVQHSNASFIHQQWPAYSKPFERFWTPEQCAYLVKCAYLIPIIDIFIAAGLLLRSTRLAALCFAMLFHLFSFTVVLMQGQPDIAVLLWNSCLFLLLPAVFLGDAQEEKAHTFSLGFYPLFVMVVFALAIPAWAGLNDKPLQNKLDLMQANNREQFIYLDKESKNKLPLYVQSFATPDKEDYYKLSITKWGLHETHTRQVLDPLRLTAVTNYIRQVYGQECSLFIPASSKLANK